VIPVALASGSAAAYGLSDYLGGVASRRTGALRVICVSYPVSVLLVGLLVPLVSGTATPAGVAWAAASGLASGLAVWSFYLALERGPMSVISPLTAVLAAAVPLAVGLVSGERPGPVALVGAVVAVLATTLVSLEGPALDGGHPRLTRDVVALTVVAGLTFAAYFVLLDRVPDGEGLWPVLCSRVGATVVIAAVVLARRTEVRPDRRLLVTGALIAVVDVVANVSFYYATRTGMLSVVSVLASLYPAFTVLLALTHGGERLRAVQATGMVLGVAAIALLTLG